MSDPSLERRVSALEIKVGVSGATHNGVERRLSEIEDTLKWLVRLILGALILALVGFVVSGGVASV